MRLGVNVIIGKKMANEVDGLDWNVLPRSFHRSLKIIAAWKGILVKGSKRYFAHASSPKSLEILSGATHDFDDTPAMQHRLFAATHKWFNM